ncbi:MAG: uridine kinase [Candidatus Azotimanducaceae bacterium]|jgi:uridine kinase
MSSESIFIIVVSGTSGAGKSTLIRGAVEKLPNAEALYFDDFASLGNDVQEIQHWVDNGADPNWIKTPKLAEHLKNIRENANSDKNGPRLVVILEEPFGSSRDEIRPHVDMAVHLHLEPDIALGRRLLRAVQIHQTSDQKPDDQILIKSLHGQLTAFLTIGRAAYSSAEQNAKTHAELILDGNGTIDALVEQLVDAIKIKKME